MNFRTILSLVFLAFVLSFTANAQSADEFTWKLVKEADNAQVYLKYNTHNQVTECKIITELNAPVSETMAFLSNFDNFQKWVTGYISSATMRSVPNKETYGYALIKTSPADGAPVIDGILHITFRPMTSGGWIGTIEAAPDYKARTMVMDRLEHFSGMWALQPHANGTSKFTYHVDFDPTQSEAANQQLAENHLNNVLNLQRQFGSIATARAN